MPLEGCRQVRQRGRVRQRFGKTYVEIAHDRSTMILPTDENQAFRHVPEFRSNLRNLALTDRHWVLAGRPVRGSDGHMRMILYLLEMDQRPPVEKINSLFAHSGDASSRTLKPTYSNAFHARPATRSLRAPAHSTGTSPLW
jgi:hypothetical protein